MKTQIKAQLKTRIKTRNAELLSIGELARSSAVHIETIRFNQLRGLLAEPERPPGGIWRYGEADAARLRFIKSAQKLGFTLDEVMTLLPLEVDTQCNEASKIAQQKLYDVRGKLADLRRMEKTLSGLIGECKKRQGQVCCPLISSLQTI
jgi:MerR family transcriptional regulator, mercuric resistance operon regulatory protein